MAGAAMALCAAVTTAVTARADVARAPAADSVDRGYVELTVAADAQSAAALADTLRELLARMGLGLHVTRSDAAPAGFMAAPPKDEGERGRVSVDETPADRVKIVVTAIRGGEGSAPVERVIPRDASSAILTEQVAHVIHATLESLLATEPPAPAQAPAPGPPPRTAEPGTPPVAPPPAAPVDHPAAEGPAAPVARHDGFSLDATAFATGRGVSSGSGAVLGGGAALHMTAWRGIGRPGLWLSGSYNAPFDEQNADVTLQTTISSFRGVPSVEVLLSRILDVDVGVGAGVDVFHTVPSDPSPNVTLGPTKDLVDPIITGQIVTHIRIAASARIVVGVDVDYDAAAHRYVTSQPAGSPSRVSQPWPVRPSAMVGLCVPLMGPLGCGGAE